MKAVSWKGDLGRGGDGESKQDRGKGRHPEIVPAGQRSLAAPGRLLAIHRISRSQCGAAPTARRLVFYSTVRGGEICNSFSPKNLLRAARDSAWSRFPWRSWSGPLCYSAVIMASRSVNKVILVGNLGREAETKFTPSGVAMTRFSVATSRRWKDQQSGEWKEETDWANIVLWRQENLANYLTKGKQVFVEGRLQTRSYDDKDGKKQYMTEVVAEDVILLGGRGGDGMEDLGGGRPVSMPRSAPRPAAAAEPMDQGITDDDVPF